MGATGSAESGESGGPAEEEAVVRAAVAVDTVGEVPAADTGDDVPRARPRRRGRTAAMLAAAAVLGVVAGACTGYLVQAGRAPTALPPLSQPVVAQAQGEAEPLSAAQDRRVRTDGDLRKLLIPRPKGTEDNPLAVDDEGWADLAAYAERYKGPASTFDSLIDDEFRRAAVTSWRVGDAYTVDIALVQFRQESKPAASEWAENGDYWADKEGDTRRWPLPGAGEGTGTVYVHDAPERKAGYLPLYSAEAHAWRGDIYMEIHVYGSEPIAKAKIMDLAERQVGKL
ncbi:hypothetical protein ACGFNQ_16575 [Streptomyces asoensis]|uniref:hypothetical protein n=1 Tax=Streptomyces asoensis TaxID=249586 RepID=UPI00371075FD